MLTDRQTDRQRSIIVTVRFGTKERIAVFAAFILEVLALLNVLSGLSWKMFTLCMILFELSSVFYIDVQSQTLSKALMWLIFLFGSAFSAWTSQFMLNEGF